MPDKSSSRITGRPGRNAAAALQSRILDGAQAAFVADGFVGASIAGIATLAGTTKLTLYRRFGSKEALLVAVAERELTAMRRDLDHAVSQSTDAIDALETVALALLRLLTKDGHLSLAVQLFGEAAHSEDVARQLFAWDGLLSGFLDERISIAQESGALSRRHNAAYLGRVLFDLIEGIARRLRRDILAFPRGTEAEFKERWDDFCRLAERNPADPIS